jgi:3-oxoacyl-[acyl-carrier-protein] synthase-3
MHFRRVCLESFGYTLPDEVVSTSEIERRLAPLYERLRLPQGRLELMTGIRERRFFPPGTRPSTISIQSARLAIAASGIDERYFGALVHGSVCRDFLEPATACRVHHGLRLPADAMIYDVSNACLGLLNGMVQVANMIELGQIRAGIVVGTECGRALVENTITQLNADLSLTRESVKNFIASLTIGSASVAMVLCDEELSATGNRLTAATVYCDTSQHELCQSRGLETLRRVRKRLPGFWPLLAGNLKISSGPSATRWASPIASSCSSRWGLIRRSISPHWKHSATRVRPHCR